MRIKYFIQLGYKGTNYHGWQIQPNALSVQEVLNSKLSVLLKEKIETTGAGRTDSGVHARYFVADFFSTNLNLDVKDKVIYKLNALLPADIVIYDIQRVPDSSNARFDACSRTYKYYMSDKKLPFIDDYYYRVYPVPDIEIMNSAANLLLENTDFTSFSKLHSETKTNICIIKKASWELSNGMLIFTIEADRFLWNMVRSIVGTLIEVGRKNLSTLDFQHIIDDKDRSKAGISVPAKGLVLYDIEYKKSLLKKIIQNQNKSFINLV